MKQRRRNTNLNRALEFVHKNLFTPATTREGSVKVLVVITDGQSQDGVDYAATIHADGILTVAVGIGSEVSVPQLANLASDPSYVARTPSYEQLYSAREQINDKFCSNKTPENCGQAPRSGFST